MAVQSNIRYIANKDIDRQKWDQCMDRVGNSLIYGYSAFLDNMVQTWDALILNDYEAIMPLPVRKKWGITYLFQPFLTPILGVFGNDISEKTVSDFLLAIPDKVKLWDISLNHFNPVSSQFKLQYHRHNFILSLANKSYDELRKNYSDNIIRNSNKATRAGCECRRDIPLEDIITICKQQWPTFTKVVGGAFDNIPKVYSEFGHQSMTYGVYSKEQVLLTGCLFLSHRDRAYYWLAGNDPASKETGASHLLIDQFIRDHAGRNLILDFEGSDVKGIAEFYERFGAVSEPYTTIYYNHLPFPLNLLKKVPNHYLSLPR